MSLATRLRPYAFAVAPPGDGPPAGYAAWWDAADPGTITETGGLVSQWDDKSGNGYHLTSSGTARPTTGAKTIGGLNVIEFDGIDDQMEAAGVGNYPAFTYFAMFQPNGTLLNDADLIGTSTGPLTLVRPRWASNGNRMLYAGSAWDPGLRPAIEFPHTWGFANTGTSSAREWLDTVEASGGNPGNNAINGTVRVGRGANNSFYLSVWIGELLIYPSALSSVEGQAVETYLRDRWSL